jgi:hypothetical protein
MKKRILQALGIAAIVAAGALALTSTAPQAEALPNCRCLGPIQQTSATGTGESCADALNDLYAQLSGSALCGVDGICDDEGITITQSCYEYGQPGAWWGVDGYHRYRCLVCF